MQDIQGAMDLFIHQILHGIGVVPTAACSCLKQKTNEGLVEQIWQFFAYFLRK